MTNEQAKFIQELGEERQAEIVAGKNAFTSFPLYVIYDLEKRYAEGHSAYSGSTSVFGEHDEYTTIGAEGGTEDGNRDDDEVTVHFHDRFVGCAFTRKAAEEFIASERHNLSKPRIYVEHVGHRNIQMRMLCEMFNDNNN